MKSILCLFLCLFFTSYLAQDSITYSQKRQATLYNELKKAVIDNNVDSVKLYLSLMDKDSLFYIKTYRGKNAPLAIAYRNNNKDILKALINKENLLYQDVNIIEGFINKPNTKLLEFNKDGYGHVPLLSDNLTYIKVLYYSSLNSNSDDLVDILDLNIYKARGRNEIIDFLLDKKIKGSEEFSIPYSFQKDLGLFKQLKKAGYLFNEKHLEQALNRNQTNVVEFLLNEPIKLTEKHLAISIKKLNLNSSKFLIESGLEPSNEMFNVFNFEVKNKEKIDQGLYKQREEFVSHFFEVIAPEHRSKLVKTAIKFNQFDLVKPLLDTMKVISQDSSFVFWSTLTLNIEMTEYLLNKGYPIAKLNKVSPLAIAVINLDLTMLKLLLKFNGDILSSSRFGQPLESKKRSSSALSPGLFTPLDLLFFSDQGAPLSYQSFDVKHKKQAVMIGYFLDSVPLKLKADSSFSLFKTRAFLFGIDTGNEDLLKSLLSEDFNINAKINNPLIHAVESGNLTMVKLLIENNADVNITIETDYKPSEWEYFYCNYTPLIAAKIHGQEKIKNYLLLKGAKRTKENKCFSIDYNGKKVNY
jgi:ankyrin repeat protein